MAEVKNYQEVVDIASKHLGKVGGDGYKDTYDPALLVKILEFLIEKVMDFLGMSSKE